MNVDQLLTEQEVHQITRVSKETLRRWRKENRIIGWIKIGKSIRYRESDVLNLLNTVGVTNS